jgi:rhodanese-related sulfurtransferase
MINRYRMLYRPAALLVLLALSVSLTCCAYITGEAIKSPAQQPVIKDIPAAQTNDLIQANQGNARFVILDVRTQQEYTNGHLPKAVNLDFYSGRFKDSAKLLDKNLTYLVYCQTGARSAAAAEIMVELGFKDIYNMTGGITEWQSAGLPVVK